MSKSTFNWGIAIAVFLTAFTLILMTKVIFSISNDFDLVTEDYYEDEIKYQEIIDKMSNSKALQEPLEIIRGKNKLIIQFPTNLNTKDIRGIIKFYRSSNAKLDRDIKIVPDVEFKQTIDLTKFEKGMWRLLIDWSAGGVLYYNEDDLYLR